MMIAGPFADALREGRERHNARFATIKRAFPSIDGARFATLLVEVGDPIVRAVHALDASRTRAAADAVHDVLLEVVARELDRTRPAVVDVLCANGVGLAPVIADAPRRTLAIVVNATFRVASVLGTSLDAWRGSCARIARALEDDRDALGDALVVAAWQAGVPMLRAAALDALLRLPERVARAVIASHDGAPITEIVAKLRADEWSMPSRFARRGAADPVFVRAAIVGGFRGLGGPFVAPPRAEVRGGRLFATVGDERFVVWADRYGVSLEASASSDASETTTSDALALMHDGRVAGFGARSPAPLVPVPVASWASIGRTLIAIPERSHRVCVIGLAEST
ncbi:hypothetical protein [Sandaracinus amylolyticus]|nr:hypothetical protein [Sandaracinus amylolyticus]